MKISMKIIVRHGKLYARASPAIEGSRFRTVAISLSWPVLEFGENEVVIIEIKLPSS